MVNNNAAAQYIAALASKTGLPFVSSFLKSGHFVVVATQQDLPLSLRRATSAPARKIASVYDPTEKITWFVAENLPSASVYGNMLREIGIHFGLLPMLGDRKMKEVIADARHLFTNGNPAMLNAWRKVASGKKTMGGATSDEVQEAIGYLVEDPGNHDLGIAKKIFSSIKVFLFKKDFPVGRLSEADLSVLAASAAREAVRVRRKLTAATINSGKEKTLSESSERRKNGAYRKSIEEMTAEEMKRELLVDSLTGLGNRRALDEAEQGYASEGKQKIKAFIDVDSLKFVNDHLGGHDAGDKLLVVVASALRKATEDSFRLSGDEFCFLASTEEEAENIASHALEILQQVVITYEVNGRVYEYNNPGFSYGLGKDLETADRNMLAHKKERARVGLRADRAQTPPGLVQITPPRREDVGSRETPGTKKPGSPSVKEYLSTFAIKNEEDQEPPREPTPPTTFQP